MASENPNAPVKKPPRKRLSATQGNRKKPNCHACQKMVSRTGQCETEIIRRTEYAKAITGKNIQAGQSELAISEVALLRGEKTYPEISHVAEWSHRLRTTGFPTPMDFFPKRRRKCLEANRSALKEDQS